MTESSKASNSKLKEGYDPIVGSGLSGIRNIKSSDGARSKTENAKIQQKHFLLNETQIPERSAIELTQPSPNQRYRIKTTHSYHTSIQKIRHERGITANSQNSHAGGLSQNRNLNPIVDKEAFRANQRYGVPDIEQLHEETLQLKKQINSLQEENTKLKTKNTNLEREAYKFEKMFQEVSTNPNKKRTASKIDENNGPALKQMIRDLKNELEDKEEELNNLKKKTKVTKVNELEVQLRTFQEESMRLRVFIEELKMKYQENLRQEEGKKAVQTYNAEFEKLKREFKALENKSKSHEWAREEYQRTIAELEKKLKKEQTQATKQSILKDKEIIKLKSQLLGVSLSGNKTGENLTSEDQLRKELEKTALENLDMRQQLVEKNDYIAKLEKQLKEKERHHIEVNHAPKTSKQFLVDQVHPPKEEPIKSLHTTERTSNREAENLKSVINNPSYSSHVKNDDDSKKSTNGSHSREQATEPKEKKINQEDVKKFGYEINLSFRVKGLTFDTLQNFNWGDGIQKDGTLNVKTIKDILKKDLFGLKKDECELLAKYLVQENNTKGEGKLNIDGLKNTLTGLIGPLPYWDEEMKRKLHAEISKICTLYRESLEEGLKLACVGGNLTRKNLDEGARNIDIIFTFAQLEYIVTKLYERTHDVNKLPIKDLFEIFHMEISDSKKELDLNERRSSDKKNKPGKNSPKRGEKDPRRTSKQSYDDLDAEYKQELDNMLQEYENREEKGPQNPKKSHEPNNSLKDEDDDYNDEEFGFDDKKSDGKIDPNVAFEEDNDEQDQNEEKYEFLFPQEPQQEKITERGEDEEEDESYKEDDYEEEEREEEPKVSEKNTNKQDNKIEIKKKNTEPEDEESKNEYEEQDIADFDRGSKTSKENKEIEEEPLEESEVFQFRDGLQRGGSNGSEPFESRQMMESAKTNFTNSTQITEPKSEFFHLDESRGFTQSQERIRESPEGSRLPRIEENNESQEDVRRKLPDIIEEFDKQEEVDEDYEDDYENDS